jgi:hypothetical protein
MREEQLVDLVDDSVVSQAPAQKAPGQRDIDPVALVLRWPFRNVDLSIFSGSLASSWRASSPGSGRATSEARNWW